MDFFQEKNINFLKISSNKLFDNIDVINRENITSIGINRLWGYELDNINFLEKCPNINNITIIDNDIDISGIIYLKDLRLLSTNSNPKTAIDLCEFEKLEKLRIDMHKNWLNIDKASSLKKLLISSGYKEQDLNYLKHLTKLEELKIWNSTLLSLSGMELLESIKSFEGFNLKKIENLDFYKEITTIDSFKLESCKKIINYEGIRTLKSIEILYFINCSEIRNLKFLTELPNIKEFCISNTNVIDGDMTPLQNIKSVLISNKKHFNMKQEDFIRFE